jgi:hypothetical protein
VQDAQTKIAEYIAHRKEREAQLIATLADAPRTIPELVARMYGDTRKTLWPAAARQLLAYLDALREEGRIEATPLDRALTPEESALLNPAWASLVDPELAKVIEAELGASYRIERIEAYRLVQ